MINTNLRRLRKIHQYTQEELAEKLNVSRQSVAKWENGESTPDIDSCIKLAKLYNVRLDDLVNHSEEKSGIIVPPKGKFFFGAVVVGERGQIVIPKEARDIFNINAGDKFIRHLIKILTVGSLNLLVGAYILILNMRDVIF